MRKVLLFLLIQGYATNVCHAHSTKQAIFSIEIKDSISIRASFPWTLRKALINYEPSLFKIKDSLFIHQVLQKYISDNLILKNDKNTPLPLIRLEKINTQSYHSVDYNIWFSGNTPKTITNTLLFNLNNKHTNIHEINWEGNHLQFNTSINFPSFNIPQKKTSSIWYSIIAIPLLLLLLFIRKK